MIKSTDIQDICIVVSPSRHPLRESAGGCQYPCICPMHIFLVRRDTSYICVHMCPVVYLGSSALEDAVVSNLYHLCLIDWDIEKTTARSATAHCIYSASAYRAARQITLPKVKSLVAPPLQRNNKVKSLVAPPTTRGAGLKA